MELEEMKKRLGCVRAPEDRRDFLFRSTRRLYLPQSMDYTDEMTKVEDQGSEGSCVGFACGAMKEWQEKKDWNRDLDLSSRFIYEKARKIDNFPDTQDGTDIRSAMKVLFNDGVCTEDCWPYVPQNPGEPCGDAETEASVYKISTFTAIHGIQDMKVALVNNGPFVIGVVVFDSWYTNNVDQTGDIQMPTPEEVAIIEQDPYAFGGHAICIVGYDDAAQRFKFKNSWGTDWGKAGYGTFPYDYLKDYGWDAWTTIDVVSPDIPQPKPLKVGGEVTGTLNGKDDFKIYTVKLGKRLKVKLEGPAGSDFDLYIKKGEHPSLNDYDDRGYTGTASEEVSIDKAKSGDYYIMVRSYQGNGEYKLKVDLE
jgi:C1A family cysteine protease